MSGVCVLPVRESDGACAQLPVAVDADAAGRKAPVAVEMGSGSTRRDAAGEGRGLGLRRPKTTVQTDP